MKAPSLQTCGSCSVRPEAGQVGPGEEGVRILSAPRDAHLEGGTAFKALVQLCLRF